MNQPTDQTRFSVPAREDAAEGKAKPRRLGKGLGALLGETRREEPLVRESEEASESGKQGSAVSGLASLPVSAIEPHPDQPRRRFDPDALEELAASIAARGVIQPVIVRPLGNGRYQLVAGERRWRAAQQAQVTEIPVVIRDLEERDVMALALIENIQREDLNPVEEARAYHRLAEQEGMTQAEIARLVEKSRSHVANLQRLLALPDAVLEQVENGQLSMGHARALIGHENAEGLSREVIEKNLSVRDLEKLARRRPRESENGGGRRAREPRGPAENADIAAIQSHLEELLGLSVRITSDADPRAGGVTIRYRTLDQLDLICQRLTGGDI